jgi:hypothetical protein
MSKNLSETAAEIIAASVGKNQEPMKKMPAEVVDVGGATPTDDYSGPDMENGHGHGQRDTDVSIGKKTSDAVKVAPKPMAKGTPAKVVTTAVTMSEEDSEEVDLEDLSEEELDELLSTLSEEELEQLAEELGDDEDEEEDDDLEDLSEEEVVVKEAINIKELVKSNMISMKEDVDALFNGESLSEEFRTKATTIVEAAVQSRVEAVVQKVVENNDAILAEQIQDMRNTLAEQVDDYLNYVVGEWLKENELAIESGIRAELVEDFISGLKSLFEQHYIEIPEEKVSVLEEMSEKVVDLEETLNDVLQEKANIQAELNTAKKNEAIRKICEGLTEIQVQKMISLAEGVEFTTDGDFNKKLAVIRENYFSNKIVKSGVKLDEGTPAVQPEVETTGLMTHYVKAISKSLPK